MFIGHYPIVCRWPDIRLSLLNIIHPPFANFAKSLPPKVWYDSLSFALCGAPKLDSIVSTERSEVGARYRVMANTQSAAQFSVEMLNCLAGGYGIEVCIFTKMQAIFLLPIQAILVITCQAIQRHVSSPTDGWRMRMVKPWQAFGVHHWGSHWV